MLRKGGSVSATSRRQDDLCTQAMFSIVRQNHVAAMGARARAGDRQAQPDAPRITVTRGLESHERLEYIVDPLRRNPRAVVIDGDIDVARVLGERHAGARAVADGILREIQDGAL